MRLVQNLDDSWYTLLENQFSMAYFVELEDFILEEYISSTIYPPLPLIFNAFNLCKPDMVKVVLLGQDPYHGPGQAHGLSFSVPENQKIPPSLKNIYTELHNDLGIIPPHHGNLENWAKQGVLLLNAVLSVKHQTPASHANKGWEVFTDHVISTLSKLNENLVFILWGNYARSKKYLIDAQKHCILEAPHPSPFSVYKGFFGCKHFSQANSFLISHHKAAINW